MKQASGLDSKRRAAGERDDNESSTKTPTVGLIDESELPTVARIGKRSVVLDTPEWNQACEHLNKGLPDKKVLQIPLSAETLRTGKTSKHSAIGFKRQLVNHAKRMNWKVDISLKGESLFVKNKKK
jgi:hypothetical protein